MAWRSPGSSVMTTPAVIAVGVADLHHRHDHTDSGPSTTFAVFEEQDFVPWGRDHVTGTVRVRMIR
jgi:hypothetical protein